MNAATNCEAGSRAETSQRDETAMKKLILLAILPMLSACAGGSSDSDPSAISRSVEIAVSGGQITPYSTGAGYRLSDGSFLDNLDIPTPGNVAGEELLLTGSYGLTAVLFTGDDVIVAAAGGTDGLRDAFSIIDGTTEVIPTGNVTYQGHYTVAADNAIAGHGALDLQYAVFNNTLIGTSDDTRLTVYGIVDNNGIVSGNVDFDGTVFDLDGGIYGSNADEVAAGFSDTDLGGYVYGKRQ